MVVETVKADTWDVSTSHGGWVARMLGRASRAESERTGKPVSRVHQQAKAQGRWRGQIPSAYRLQPPRPNSTRPGAGAGRAGHHERVLRDNALTRIAADLRRASVQGPRPAWTHTGILRLVASPALGTIDPAWRAAELHRARPRLLRRPRGSRPGLRCCGPCPRPRQHHMGGRRRIVTAAALGRLSQPDARSLFAPGPDWDGQED